MKKLLLLTVCASAMSIHAMSEELTTYNDIQKLLCRLPNPAPSDEELQTRIVPSQLTPKQREEIVTTARKNYSAASKQLESLDCRRYPHARLTCIAQCKLIDKIAHMTNVISSYEEIEKFIKNPEYLMFAPRVNIDQLTPEQRTTLAQLAEAHYDNRWTSLIESSRTFHKDDKARKQLPESYHFRSWEVESNIEANTQASWKADKLWEIMAQINPGYCNLRGFICAAAIPLPQLSKQELEDKVRSANLTLEQAAKVFAIANKELKTRREKDSKYLNFSDSTISEKSEITTLPDGRGPREVKIEILEDIIEIVHPYR